ncbi:hypothetical protein CWD94_26090 [Lysinibacillus xylanilyticus]|uniref:Uncharacterized protein n=1 Tax=Lysinibacillus xylanilyticus TaxID=582475 RepID=A0A2M9PYA4_9BACI|nr:hypothetical protein CWD94_26090 [Lysinibacillus xylanilyticus]
MKKKGKGRTLKWLQCIFFILFFCYNCGLISVPAGRFVADASLSLQKTFVADASLSHRAKLPGGVR